MKWKRVKETKEYIVFCSVEDNDVSAFNKLYVKKTSPLSQLTDFELILDG